MATTGHRNRLKKEHPKARTGCLTCRRRRVKCDEAKPTCARCHGAGFQCEGYSEPSFTWVVRSSASQDRVRRSSSNGSQTPNARPTTPKPRRDAPTGLVPLASRETRDNVYAPDSSSLYSAPSSPYKTAEEQSALHLFFDKLVPIMIRFSEPEVWLVTIPKLAWQHPTVRHALVAISLVANWTQAEPRRIHYGKNDVALSYMNSTVRALAIQQPSIDIALTVAVLLFVLETFMQNVNIAVVHLRGAVAMLKEYQERVARGERVPANEKEVALNHVGPVVMTAVKMFEGFLAAQANASSVDQHTAEAFETRQRLTRPGVTDAFLDNIDARNNLGAIAVKVARLHSKHRHNSRPGCYKSPVSDPQAERPPEEQLQASVTLLQHFDRLFAPTIDEHNLDCRYLLAHRTTLYMMLQDMGADVSQAGIASDLQQGDKFLSDILTLGANESLKSSSTFRNELGIIPPIFYLALSSRRCSVALRRAAATFLQQHLGSRYEGGWNGIWASRVAHEIINAGVEAGFGVAVVFPSFDPFETMSTTSTLPLEQSDKPEIWLSYISFHRNSQGSLQVESQSSGPHAGIKLHWRRCTAWTEEEIRSRPRQLNQLIGNYGYQGYFEDAVRSSAVV